MPLQETSGNVTTDAYGGGVAAIPNYIEDVFSTYLYTGTGATSTQTIPNGINESGKGALTWFKKRSTTSSHLLFDTNRGTDSPLATNSTSGQGSGWSSFFNFLSNGVSVSDDLNVSGTTYASWTFRKQPKFFDVVTYTGDGGVNGDSNPSRAIAHSLGSQPGMVIIKRTDSTSNWYGVHRNDGTNNAIWGSVNLSNACTAGLSQAGYNTYITSTTFGPFAVRDSLNQTPLPNVTGATYVAYLFAHNAGGFGLTGTDNVISCGSYVGNGSASNPITLGYEPQWILIKNASNAWDWAIFDNMRGVTANQFNGDKELVANTATAESTSSRMQFFATGFNPVNNQGVQNTNGDTYIYIAIRRGPMKVPTSGTSVFAPVAQTGGGTVTTNFPVDLAMPTYRNIGFNRLVMDRLRGGTTNQYVYLATESTTAETVGTGFGLGFDYNTSIYDQGTVSSPSYNAVYWNFRRAPSFFDEVCYTGDSNYGRQLTHNLTVSPQLLIIKARSGPVNQNWQVCYNNNGSYVQFNNTNAGQISDNWFPATGNIFFPTYVRVGAANGVNNIDYTYVAYLFATCAGVSKVGSYTGNGTTQTINCGFTGGARFVLIKRTDAAGDWYVYDTARGMTTLTDPYLLLNSTAAESATLGSVTTVSTGFAVNASILAAINTNAASYIFLAIS